MFALAAVVLLHEAAALLPVHPQLALNRHPSGLVRPLPSQASTSVATSAWTSSRGLVTQRAEAVAAGDVKPASLDKCAIVKYAVAIATQVLHCLAVKSISIKGDCFAHYNRTLEFTSSTHFCLHATTGWSHW
jgi:hypothetical protein